MMNSFVKRALWTTAATAAAYAAGRFALEQWRRYDFRDRLVVITGGSRGLGLVLARRLAEEGASLVICARDDDELADAGAELRGQAPFVAAYACDLSQPGCINSLFARIRREVGAVDVLINNAGIIQVGPLETMTSDDFQQAMDIHCWTVLQCIDQVLPEMRRRGQGRIVNIASIGGKIGVPHLAPYCASKFALVGLSQSLRAELAKDGVYVTTVCPGLMRTGSPRNALFKGKHRAEYAWFSIGSGLPLLSMSADRAASQILTACRYGRANATLSLPAKLAVCANALAPELTGDLMTVMGRLLPAAGGVGATSLKGSQSTSAWSPSVLTKLNEQAAARNNEF